MNVSGGTATMPVAQARQGQVQQPIAASQAAPVATRKRPWYRKKRFIIPLTMLIIMGMVAGGGAWYLNQQFGHLQEVSTPDPNSAAGKALQEPTAER